MNTSLIRWGAACAALLLPALAEAHPGHGTGMGFVAGALHPLAGFDHLIALVATGLLAGRLGGRAGVAILVAFPAMLGLGAIGGWMGTDVGATEFIIAMSVVVLGLLAWAPPRQLPVATATLAAAFALFHGHAHGIEAAAGIAPLTWIAGVVASSVVVLCAASLAARRTFQARGLQAR